MTVPIDLAAVLGSRRLRRRTPLDDMPGDCLIGWYSVMCTHVFTLAVWFEREHGKSLLSIAMKKHVLRSMVKSEAENDMEAEFLMTSNGGQVFVAMRNLLGDL
jgi:hypothetical protein